MLFWLCLHFAIGLAGTWLARRYAIQRELFDHPGERRSHAVPTPRGGGIAIVIALLVAACVLGWRNPHQVVLVAGFSIGLLLVAGIGMVDDHRPLSPWLRLGVQAVAAAIFALAVAGAWGDLSIALIAFVAVIALSNIWNFMDGINGIAGTQAALVAAGLAFVMGGTWGWLALALTAACLGFLPFNFPKARIFLGDVGSGTLGFALGALLVFAISHGETSPFLLLLPFSAFLVDSSLTLLRRVLKGERWWTAHAQHAYQRWAARNGAHTTVTFAYAGWTAASWLLAWWLASSREERVGVISAAWFAIAAALWAWLQYSDIFGRKPRAAAIGKHRK
jgi:UDP-N-acetylmuramyl pentapeptide phosphotransferase/UDP-N-acetylglucosamine-1-phosphate transferase